MQMQFNSYQVHAYIRLEGAAVTSVEYECTKYNVKKLWETWISSCETNLKSNKNEYSTEYVKYL